MKTVNTRNKPYGMTCKNGDIIFCTKGKGLVELNFGSEKEDVIFRDNSVSDDSRVVAGNNMVCYTCPSTHTVNVLDFEYKLLFKFKDENVSTYPAGVASDDHMTFYIVGRISQNVLAISSDGIKKKDLLSKRIE